MHDTDDTGLVMTEETIGLPTEWQELVGTDIDIGKSLGAAPDDENSHLVAVIEEDVEGRAPWVVELLKRA
jgi:hypothetical protein